MTQTKNNQVENQVPQGGLKMLNEEGKTLYISFLPIILIIAIVLGSGYFLLQGDIKLPKFGNDITEVRRLERFPTVVNTSEIKEKQRVIIKSQEELNTFLNNLDSTGLLVLNEDINFEDEYLIAATTETEATTGFGLKIKKVYADKDDQTLTISIEETEPGDNCVVEEQPNVSADLVAITKTDWKIEFERIKKVDECN